MGKTKLVRVEELPRVKAARDPGPDPKPKREVKERKTRGSRLSQVAAATAQRADERERNVPHVHDDKPTTELIAMLREDRATPAGTLPARVSPSDALVHAIFERLSNGETMREILRSDPRLPSYSAIYKWIAQSPELLAYYRRAREVGMDAMAEDMLAIADDGRNDWMEKIDKDGQSAGWVLNGEHVQRSRLRIETRLKLLGKWAPARYGDRLAVEGTTDGPPVQTSDATLERFTSLLTKLAQGKRMGRIIDASDAEPAE